MDCRLYCEEVLLQQAYGGDFVNEALYDQFADFKKKMSGPNLAFVKNVPLLTYWLKVSKVTSIKHIVIMDEIYFLMTSSDLDTLCQWVIDTKMSPNGGMCLQFVHACQFKPCMAL